MLLKVSALVGHGSSPYNFRPEIFLKFQNFSNTYLQTVKNSAIMSKVAKPVSAVLLVQKVLLNARPEFHAPVVKDLKHYQSLA